MLLKKQKHQIYLITSRHTPRGNRPILEKLFNYISRRFTISLTNKIRSAIKTAKIYDFIW